MNFDTFIFKNEKKKIFLGNVEFIIKKIYKKADFYVFILKNHDYSRDK